jgi:hypothetical protein
MNARIVLYVISGTGIPETIWITINELPHLAIAVSDLIAIQSWIDESRAKWCIEFSVRHSEPVLCEYIEREMWETILKKVTVALTGGLAP